jgi:CheY-like chemotaxis protein
MAHVLTFARDMVFTSKIREVARQLGVNVAAARDAARLPAEVAAAGARLVILDLRLPGALEALAALKADPGCAHVATVGFVDHEKTDVMDAARAAGCGEVLTKGQFAHALPKLLGRMT